MSTELARKLLHAQLRNQELESRIKSLEDQVARFSYMNAMFKSPFKSPEAKNPTPAFGSQTMSYYERKIIVAALRLHKEGSNSCIRAAKSLGIGKATLYRKVALYKIDISKGRNK